MYITFLFILFIAGGLTTKGRLTQGDFAAMVTVAMTFIIVALVLAIIWEIFAP